MRKLKSRCGVTLAETLICVALLAIMTAGATVVSGVVISTRSGMIATADSQIVGSTVLEALSKEVRYGRNIKTESITETDPAGLPTTIYFIDTFDSVSFGSGVKLSVNTAGRVEAIGAALTADDTKLLLPEEAYSGLKVKALRMEVKEEVTGEKNVVITVTVAGRNDGELWTGEVTVKPLNKIR